MKTVATFFIVALLVTSTFAQQNKSTQTDNSKPFVLGVVDDINSAVLGETRVLNIYLPEGYNKNDSTKYAVIYLLDGSADEDFIHVAGLFQFNSF